MDLDTDGLSAEERESRAVGITALSGKGGAAKSFLQYHLSNEAVDLGMRTLVMDADPEQNLSQCYESEGLVLVNTAGLGDVLEAAGIELEDSDYDIEAGAKKLLEVIRTIESHGLDFIPAGPKLQKFSQTSPQGDEWQWLLRDIFEEAGIYEKYAVMMPDTGGRRGALVTMIMYACDVAYSPITMMGAAVVKAVQARERVNRIQRSHPLKWAGVVLTGLDTRAAANTVIREDAAESFGAELDGDGKFTVWGEIIDEIPYRPATVHEAYQSGFRLSDYPSSQVKQIRQSFKKILRRLLESADQQRAEVVA